MQDVIHSGVLEYNFSFDYLMIVDMILFLDAVFCFFIYFHFNAIYCFFFFCCL